MAWRPAIAYARRGAPPAHGRYLAKRKVRQIATKKQRWPAAGSEIAPQRCGTGPEICASLKRNLQPMWKPPVERGTVPGGSRIGCQLSGAAEPPGQCVPRLSLGTRLAAGSGRGGRRAARVAVARGREPRPELRPPRWSRWWPPPLLGARARASMLVAMIMPMASFQFGMSCATLAG